MYLSACVCVTVIVNMIVNVILLSQKNARVHTQPANNPT